MQAVDACGLRADPAFEPHEAQGHDAEDALPLSIKSLRAPIQAHPDAFRFRQRQSKYKAREIGKQVTRQPHNPSNR